MNLKKFLMILTAMTLLTATAFAKGNRGGEDGQSSATQAAGDTQQTQDGQSSATQNGSEGQSATVANPLTAYDSLAALASAAGVSLPALPDGATDAAYNTIDATPLVADVAFTLDGISYDLRAARTEDEDVIDGLSGVYSEFEREWDDEDVANGKTTVAAFACGIGYELESHAAGTEALATWYVEADDDVSAMAAWLQNASGTAYTLYTANGTVEQLAAVMRQLLTTGTAM